MSDRRAPEVPAPVDPDHHGQLRGRRVGGPDVEIEAVLRGAGGRHVRGARVLRAPVAELRCVADPRPRRRRLRLLPAKAADGRRRVRDPEERVDGPVHVALELTVREPHDGRGPLRKDAAASTVPPARRGPSPWLRGLARPRRARSSSCTPPPPRRRESTEEPASDPTVCSLCSPSGAPHSTWPRDAATTARFSYPDIRVVDKCHDLDQPRLTQGVAASNGALAPND